MKEPFCPITGEKMERLFTRRLLGKYDVDYFISPTSRIIKTEKPYWLAEAYADAIADTDVGLVFRNIQNRDSTIMALNLLRFAHEKFVDVAGGYGLFTRLMRDSGYDFHTTDPYCKNIFARLHEPPPGIKAAALTAFEVMEHVEDPVGFVSSAFAQYGTRTLLFSTLNYGDKVPAENWWYWTSHTGQHITFYNTTTFDMLARRLGCRYFAFGSTFHLITDLPLTLLQRMAVRHRKIRNLMGKLSKGERRSLLEDDFKLATAQANRRLSIGGNIRE